MPYIRIETNISKDKVPANFVKELSASLAQTLGKPEAYCAVAVVPDVNMIFGGTTEPCAQGFVMSIGQMGVEANKAHSKVLYEKISKDLGIPKTRMYLTFDDRLKSDVAYDGTTFDDIL